MNFTVAVPLDGENIQRRRSRWSEVCATMEQGGKTIDLVVLGGVVDRGVAFVVSGVHDGEESARIEGEVVQPTFKRNDVYNSQSVFRFEISGLSCHSLMLP